MDALAMLIPRGNPNGNCTLSTCPVTESIYGYKPNLAATILFLIIFAATIPIYAWQGYRTKTWFFTVAMVCGSISELIGYIAKIMLYQNAFSYTGFILTVVLLTFAPAFYAGGIYYTFKYICLTFNPSLSRLQPKWYTWIFISCDIISIALQGAGGALSSASTNMKTLHAGSSVAIAGLVFQVVTMVCFGILAADYGLAVRRNKNNLNPATKTLRESLRFKLFLVALWIAYFGILIRCCYRVAELADGWVHNPVLHIQDLFICMDSLPIGIAAIVLVIWHPGYCFPKDQQELALVQQKSIAPVDDAESGRISGEEKLEAETSAEESS